MVFKKKMDEAIKEELDEDEDSPAVKAARELGRPVQQSKKETETRPLVMAQLPTRVTRKVVDPNTGEQFEAVSYEEALQEMLESIREIKKAVI